MLRSKIWDTWYEALCPDIHQHIIFFTLARLEPHTPTGSTLSGRLVSVCLICIHFSGHPLILSPAVPLQQQPTLLSALIWPSTLPSWSSWEGPVVRLLMKGTGIVHGWDSHVWWGQWSHWQLGWFCSLWHGQTGWPAGCLRGVGVEVRAAQMRKSGPQKFNFTCSRVGCNSWGQISAMLFTWSGMTPNLSESLLLHLQYGNDSWNYVPRGILKAWRCRVHD